MRSVAFSAVVVLLAVSCGWAVPPPPSEPAESPASVDVFRAVIATSIEDREPMGESEEFPPEVMKLFCFVEVRGVVGETVISHVWYWEGREMARVDLDVRSARWRTWSSKTIVEDWTGAWRVDVLDSGGEVLRSVGFQIAEPEEADPLDG